MNLIERHVIEILKENKTEWNGVEMWEMKMIVDDYGCIKTVDVILLESDYNLIKQKGYYLC